MQFFCVFLAAHRDVGGWEWVKRVLSIKTGANPINLILHNEAIWHNLRQFSTHEFWRSN